MNILYSLGAVALVSVISMVGALTLSLGKTILQKLLIYFISFAAGTLLGDVFIHLLPEAFRSSNNASKTSIAVFAGLLVFFVLEEFIHWRHCHTQAAHGHPHPFSYSILVGDGVHNFIDGVVIAASFAASIPLGIATTLAVIAHEIPQEIGDFGSLLYAGFSKAKALLFNFFSAITAFAGILVVVAAGAEAKQLVEFLVPFTAGGFIYIATADLIPEFRKCDVIKKSLRQLAIFMAGIGLMALLKIID